MSEASAPHPKESKNEQKNISLCLISPHYYISYAQKMVLNSMWRDSVISIDGSLADWDQPFRYFDSKSKLQYSIVNDDKYIYISVKTNDDKAMMKVMRAGMYLIEVSDRQKAQVLKLIKL